MDVLLGVLIAVVLLGFVAVLVVYVRAIGATTSQRRTATDKFPESGIFQWLHHLIRGDKRGF